MTTNEEMLVEGAGDEVVYATLLIIVSTVALIFYFWRHR